MTSTEPLPAIRRIDTDRDDLCAFEVVGHFTEADMENAYGMLEAAYVGHDKIDVLVRFTDYDGFDWSAAFDETTFRGKSEALKRVRKYAVVGGPMWMQAAIGVFRPLTPVDVKHFSSKHEAEAWEWIGGRPVPTA